MIHPNLLFTTNMSDSHLVHSTIHLRHHSKALTFRSPPTQATRHSAATHPCFLLLSNKVPLVSFPSFWRPATVPYISSEPPTRKLTWYRLSDLFGCRDGAPSSRLVHHSASLKVSQIHQSTASSMSRLANSPTNLK